MQVKINNIIIDPSHYSFDENSNLVFNDEYKELYNAQIKESSSLTVVSPYTGDQVRERYTEEFKDGDIYSYYSPIESFKVQMMDFGDPISSDSSFVYDTGGLKTIATW